MTVREIVSEGLVINGIKDKKYIEEKVYEILELVGLVREHAGRYPHEFSGGQRQRIGIARSVIMNPEMIIADEPISALDVSIQAQVINLLNELRERLGLTILFIAHDLSVVKYFSDRIGVMYFGKWWSLPRRTNCLRTRSTLIPVPCCPRFRFPTRTTKRSARGLPITRSPSTIIPSIRLPCGRLRPGISSIATTRKKSGIKRN